MAGVPRSLHTCAARVLLLRIILNAAVAGTGDAYVLHEAVAVNADASTLLRESFPDLLPFPGHSGSGAFSDLGAWHGFALPDAGSEGGFAGPFVHGEWLAGGHWLSPSSLVRLSLSADGRSDPWPPSEANATVLPGLLRQSWKAGPLSVVSDLVFAGPRTAVVRNRAVNKGSTPVSVAALIYGEATGKVSAAGAQVTLVGEPARKGEPGVVTATVNFDPSAGVQARADGSTYSARGRARKVEPNGEKILYYTVSVTLNQSEKDAAAEVSQGFFNDPEGGFQAAESRWERTLRAVAGAVAGAPSARQRVAAKAASSLVLDWRGATGPALLHGGCTPTIAGGLSNGMWSWDSWKHAAGLATFDPELGADQIRALFDHQGKKDEGFVGMIPDKIALPPDTGAAWGNTKPPLAAWATALVFARSRDIAFLKEIFPKLEAFHAWWYKSRDHDQNGLCEFGATGNDLQGMKWESGMDNAPRFDKTAMERNSDHAWSANQESVDLNSFLYLEKLVLASFADELGNHTLAAAYRERAAHVRATAQARLFDNDRGYFFDRQLGETGEFVGPMGCEGFAALWSGLASPEQAARVRAHLMNSSKFNTKVPFGCVAVDAPEFNQDGYWRGPVWLDQAYFAQRGLLRYGFAEDARASLSKLMAHAEGLDVLVARDSSKPFTENYNPLTGARQGSEWFGWSAAHLLLLTAPGRAGELPFDMLPGIVPDPAAAPAALVEQRHLVRRHEK